MTTYNKAHREIMTYLESCGWEVKRGLKVPHATHRHGIRLWFKPQAILGSWDRSLTNMGEARSMTCEGTIVDVRTVETVIAVNTILAFVEGCRGTLGVR